MLKQRRFDVDATSRRIDVDTTLFRRNGYAGSAQTLGLLEIIAYAQMLTYQV